MSRYTGPTRRINRRFGTQIFPIKQRENAQTPPGIHGPTLRRKKSEYSVGLDEKQKLRFAYGLTESQFRLTFAKAKRKGGVTGDNFLTLLETRLDNVIFKLGLARTRAAARQFVAHGHVAVNGHKVDIPSYSLNAGDVIEVRARTSSKQLATRGIEENTQNVPPAWLEFQPDTHKGIVNRLPNSEELPVDFNVQLIVEFYSR